MPAIKTFDTQHGLAGSAFIFEEACALQGSPSISSLVREEQAATAAAEEAEVMKAIAKLAKEAKAFNSFQAEREEYQRAAQGLKAEILDARRQEQRQAVEEFQEVNCPMRDLVSIEHANTFAQASLNKFCQAKGLPMNEAFKIYWMNCSALGHCALQGALQAASVECTGGVGK